MIPRRNLVTGGLLGGVLGALGGMVELAREATGGRGAAATPAPKPPRLEG